uniref:valine--tRNA ligase n=2 Tax=Mesocestoides corti TaxID=53468 RepID=A0A5K3FAN4_MESCO
MIPTTKAIVRRPVFLWRNSFYSILPADIQLQTVSDLKIQKTYQPQIVENSELCRILWRKALEERKSARPSRTFSMILPPPNITGDLHLGHALTASIQDAICRWQCMRGCDVAWVPGLDHAGLAAEMVVERNLARKEKAPLSNPRLTLGREAFLKEMWGWMELKRTAILDQLNRLGLTLDWSAEYFTLSPQHSKSVNEALFRLSEAGLVYRAQNLISWCSYLQSAISDIEVDHKQITERTMLSVPGYATKQPFGYVDVFDYKLADGSGRVPVATTRLETMLGDTALAVHPDDVRFSRLIGKFVEHPFFKNRVIPIIADSKHVDPNEGTGVVKVSPGHSAVDFEIAEGGMKLKVINVLANDGSLKDCGEFSGLPRFVARQELVERLTEKGLYRGRFSVGEATEFLATVAPISLPICSRSGDIIEPLLREQWFIDTRTMAAAASEAVDAGVLRISPRFHEATWHDWLAPERHRDWCISRQVWWGHRMPAYRIPLELKDRCPSIPSTKAAHLTNLISTTSEWVVARDLEEARRLIAGRCNCNVTEVPLNLERDTDVLDTWFSSALLPFTTFGWPQEDPELTRSYPLDLMETGQDILFFWVARMVMLGVHLTGRVPFKHVFLHGLICDANGRKMSKSKGNTIDPLKLIDGVGNLKSHQLGHDGGVVSLGADALRASLLATDFSRPAIAYAEENALDYRRFANKIWQTMRFLTSEMTRTGVSVDLKRHSIEDMWVRLLQQKTAGVSILDDWILLHAAQLARQFNASYESLCSGDSSGEGLHNCIIDFRYWWTEELCSVYLEVVKQRLRKNCSSQDLDVFVACCLCGLRLLHPLMPHLSETLWQSLLRTERSILLEAFPQVPIAQDNLDFSESHFVKESLNTVSRIKSWRVLLGLGKTYKGDIGVSGLPTDSRQQEAVRELCSALANLQQIDSETMQLTSIPCGAGISLTFQSKDVNFDEAEKILRSRLSSQIKKADALKSKRKDGDQGCNLSRSETSRLTAIEHQISELDSQLQILLQGLKRDI